MKATVHSILPMGKVYWSVHHAQHTISWAFSNQSLDDHYRQ